MCLAVTLAEICFRTKLEPSPCLENQVDHLKVGRTNRGRWIDVTLEWVYHLFFTLVT
jgi:hypothetical protein